MVSFRRKGMGRDLCQGRGMSRHAVCMACLLGILLLVPAASALHVDGVKILMDVRPGMNYTFPMGVSIDAKDPATAIAVDVMGFGQGDDGSYTQVLPVSDTGPYTARPFLSVPEPVLMLKPGEARSFNATIRVPADAVPGGRYATIYIHPEQAAMSGTGAGVVTAILVPVMLTVQGGPLEETGTITGLRAADPVPGQPAMILVTLNNTGNHHYYGATANVTVTDTRGHLVAAGTSKPSVWALIPGNEMTLRVSPAPALPLGTYTVKAVARIGEGGAVLDTKTLTLTAGGAVAEGTAAQGGPGEPGRLPFLPASIPGPAAILSAAAVSAGALLWIRQKRG
jgi:hypothetical protein